LNRFVGLRPTGASTRRNIRMRDATYPATCLIIPLWAEEFPLASSRCKLAPAGSRAR
jgi:hypothetical protein